MGSVSTGAGTAEAGNRQPTDHHSGPCEASARQLQPPPTARTLHHPAPTPVRQGVAELASASDHGAHIPPADQQGLAKADKGTRNGKSLSASSLKKLLQRLELGA